MKFVPFDTQSINFSGNNKITTAGLVDFLGNGINVFTDIDITNMDGIDDDTLLAMGKLDKIKSLINLKLGKLKKITIDKGIATLLNSNKLDKNTFKLEKLLPDLKENFN